MSHSRSIERRRIASKYADDVEGFNRAVASHDLDILGDTSDDVKNYLPMAAGAVSEIAAKELKKKEDAKKKADYEKSDAGKAEKDAQDKRKFAAMAAAEALTETDPAGPKHKAAEQAELDAKAAEAKAAYYKGGASPSAGLFSSGPGGRAPAWLTMKNVAIGGGVVVGGALLWKLLFSKK